MPTQEFRAATAPFAITLSLVVVAGLLASLVVGRSHPVLIVAVLVAVALVVLIFRMPRLRLQDGRLEVRDGLARTRVITVEQIGLFVAVTALSWNTSSQPQLFVQAHDGSRLLRLNGAFWGPAPLVAIGEDLLRRGVPHETIPLQVDADELRVRHPQFVGWAEAHVVTVSILVFLGVALLVLLGFVAFARPTPL